MSSFRKDLHKEVLGPLFVLLAIALELPEDYLTKLHQYEVKSEVRHEYSVYHLYQSPWTNKPDIM